MTDDERAVLADEVESLASGALSNRAIVILERAARALRNPLPGRGEIRTALQIALEQATEAFDYAKSKDDHALCEMRYITIKDALAALTSTGRY